MIKESFLALALGVASLAAPAAAQDSRLVERIYDDSEVVVIDGKLGVQATIGFGTDERIENVAVGDAEQWQIMPNKRADLLFVKPLTADARTNMTVVTDRHTYFFDLVASPRAEPIYMLRFTYGARSSVPELAVAEDAEESVTDAPQVAEAPPAARAPDAAIAAVDPTGTSPEPARANLVASTIEQAQASSGEAGPDPALLNFAWERSGTKRLLPARVYDNGKETYLLWGQGQDVPSILVRDAAGDLSPAQFDIRGNTIVIDGVPTAIVLRGGRGSATLESRRVAAGS
jgi:type IV secretion system protein VirB9